MFRYLAYLAMAGAAGTLCRYGATIAVQRLSGAQFPLGTLCVNTLGCFMFGAVWSLAEERLAISGQTRAILLVGFLGAFTTFSTYAFETSGLIRDAEWWRLLAHLAGQNVLGLIGVLMGMSVGRWF